MNRPSHTEKQLYEQLRQARPSDRVLARSGDAQHCTALFRSLLLRAAGTMRTGVAVLETLLDRELAELPLPERALVHLDRFLEASFNPGGILDDMLRDPMLLRDFFRLVSASRWLADTMVRDANLFRWLLTTDVLTQAPTPAALAEQAALLERRHPAGRQRENALRRMQRREMLRIAAADVLGLKPMKDVLSELSALADATVDAAWSAAHALYEQRHGRAVGTRVAILALGKLGGRELNYSSDIDLMFVFEDADDDTQQRVVAVVKDTVRILTDVTQEGMLYRTDLRLRPDGGVGALALSLPATLAYYESRGALWERQMLLRARACAGSVDFGEQVLRALTPFVYPRTSMRLPSALAADIRARLAERAQLERNVKHMRGGIREIEFSLQLLQMLHAPRLPELRTPSTLQSIDALAAASLLTLEEEALLRDAYMFLRRLEHALQLEAFEQTHDLPSGDDDRQRIAWLLQLSSVPLLSERLEGTRSAVRRICEKILDTGSDDRESALPASFSTPERSLRLLADLLDGRNSNPRSGADRDRLRRLRETLLRDCGEEALPDQALAALEELLHRTSVPSAVIGLLEEMPSRRMLLRLASLAPFMLRRLERDPFALELVFTGYEESGLDTGRLQLIRDSGALGRLLLGDGDLREASAEWTRTADLALQRALRDSGGDELPFAVLALGKYGGEELIPGSDLDVIFLFAEGDMDRQQLAQRVASRTIAALQDAGGGVRLYEVDARLRPEGRSAPLAVSREAWLRYHDGRASLWERQSLLRARVAAGDAALADLLHDDIRGILGRSTLDAAQVEEIRSMRAGMEPRSRFQQSDFIDIKRSPGGLVDCEFAVQLLALDLGLHDAGSMASAIPSLAGAYPTVALELERMSTFYGELRLLQLFFRVLLDLPTNLFPVEDEARGLLARAMGSGDGRALLHRVTEGMRRTRTDFDTIVTMVQSRHCNGA